MKRNILILFAVVSLLISLTGCGGSGSSNFVAPTSTTMTSVKVSLTQNGQAVTGAEAALYTPTAAMREGLNQAQTSASSRASIGANNSEGVYKPTSVSAEGTYIFNVPTGEYTLIASKGNYKTVVTNVRAASGDSVAEGDGTSTVETKLQPTGTITGKVATGTAPMVTGAIVFLEKTSSVAIANADGSFTMTGVPVNNDKPYSIAAMSNQNGMMFTTQAKQVTMTESLSASVSGDLELKGLNGKYEISGYVKGSDGGIANVLVMASNDIIFSVGRTDNNGKFSVYVNDEDTYILSVIGSVEISKSVTVSAGGNNPTEDSLVFTINNSAPSYGSIKGSIRFSREYLELCNSKEIVPDCGRYRVRLIGSSTANTYYNSSMNIDYKGALEQEDTVVEFVFDSVPEGTYSILVDPAENGFLGSAGNITVNNDEAKTIDPIDVHFVKPVFKAWLDGHNIDVYKVYPFKPKLDELAFYYKKIGSDTTFLKGSLLTESEDSDYFACKDEDGNSFLNGKGKYEILIQNPWSDPNTGLSGTLSCSQVVEYFGSDEYIGDYNVKIVENISGVDFSIYAIGYYDGYMFGLYNDDGAKYFWKDLSSSESDSIRSETLEDNPDLYDVSKTSIIYSESNYPVSGGSSYKSVVLKYKADNGSLETKTVFNDESVIVCGAALLNQKYLCVYYGVGSDYAAKVFKYDASNSSNPFSNQVGNTYNNVNGKPIEGVALAESPAGKCYVAILYTNTDNKQTVKIYEIGENEECASYPLSNSDAIGIQEFQALADGSFYLEFVPDDDGGDNSMKSVRVISKNNFQESNLTNRKSCFMDKYGFMYRFDSQTKSIIKTASLDGEPLETYGSGYINGLLGPSKDGSTLYVW